MGFQPRARTPRDFGRRPRKNKNKTKPRNRRIEGGHRLEEEHLVSPAEILDKALNSLTRLGDQRFAVAPFHEHYDRWLLNIRNVLSEFEADYSVIDDAFRKERSRVLADIELVLNNTRIKEASSNDAIRKIDHELLNARSVLAQTDREYLAKINAITTRREHAVKPIVTSLGRIRGELNRIVHMRAGFLRRLSKRAKVEKAAEAARELDMTKEELARIERSFASDQEMLKDEYEQIRRRIVDEIERHEKEIEGIDAEIRTDDSLDARHAACEALTDALNSLLVRRQPTTDDVGAS